MNDDIIADRYVFPMGHDENLECTSYGAINMLKPIQGPFPPPTRWERFRRWLRGLRRREFRRWLSNKIYEWEEDW